MFQKYMAKGRTTADLRLTFLADGTAVANFTLAVNRKDGSGKADFIPCVIWGEKAKEFSDIIGKGSMIFIESVLRSSSRENEAGVTEYYYQMKILECEPLELKPVGAK